MAEMVICEHVFLGYPDGNDVMCLYCGLELKWPLSVADYQLYFSHSAIDRMGTIKWHKINPGGGWCDVPLSDEEISRIKALRL